MKKIFLPFVLMIGLSGFCQGIKPVKITELEQFIKESKKPLLVNFWATWCGPCVAEIPYFEREIAKHKDSIQLILVSLDYKEAYPKGIAAAVAKWKFKSPVSWLNETNADYFCPRIDSSWSGSLPASLFINNATGFRFFREEQIKEKELDSLIRRTLNQ